MQRPEMIIFDYGHTLLYEPNRSSSGGNKAIYPYIDKNPRKISIDEYDRIMTGLLDDVFFDRDRSLEVHEHIFLRSALENMGLTLSVSIPEAEKIIMRGISKGGVMPGADRMLDYLADEGIRTAVISNLCFSGDALRELLDRLLPNNRFEFVMASSEYVFRKPHPLMFSVALEKAGLTADKVWYCGDSIRKDVYGSASVGMFPVLYEGRTEEGLSPFATPDDEKNIEFEHLYIHHWDEMTDVLRGLK